MNYLMTFSSELYSEYSEIEKKIFLLSFLLSYNLLNRYGIIPNIYIDSISESIFKENIDSNAKISVALNDYKNSSNCSTVSKFYTCSLQKENFIHFDHDLFFWENPENYLKNNNFLFYKKYSINALKNNSIYNISSIISRLNNSFINELCSDINLDMFNIYNSGIISYNVDLYKKYYHDMEKIINSNNINLLSSREISSLFEFFLPYYLLKEKIKPNFIYNNSNIPNVNSNHLYTKKDNKDNSNLEDLLFRLVKKNYLEFPENKNKIENILNQSININIPAYSIVVLPQEESSLYSNLIRLMIPKNKNIKEIILLDNGLSKNTRTLISKLRFVRPVLVPKFSSHNDMIKFGGIVSKEDRILFIKSDLKLKNTYSDRLLSYMYNTDKPLFWKNKESFVLLNKSEISNYINKNIEMREISSIEEVK